MDKNRQIRTYYATLRRAWGPQHWWPAESPFEVIVGAILTQNTAWINVEKALRNLRREDVISIEKIRVIPLENLEKLIQPAGFFRQKASRLKRFVAWLDERYDGTLDRMFAQATPKLRSELLGLNGIGPETADSILLYAGQHEGFVVDAYARRIFERHGLVKPDARYDEIRTMVEDALRDPHADTVLDGPPSTARPIRSPRPAVVTPIPTVHQPSKMSKASRSQLAQDYNEFHALIVQVGKHYCLSRTPSCGECPLKAFLDGSPKITAK